MSFYKHGFLINKGSWYLINTGKTGCGGKNIGFGQNWDPSLCSTTVNFSTLNKSFNLICKMVLVVWRIK